ncbi:MAG: thioredoxin family protein [Burkholderiales bacterium]|nr:thioredoxin family protein [Burkholderiales bacterium]
MSKFTRRSVLAASLAGLSLPFASNVSAKPAVVPSIWEGQKMYDTFLKDGTGFSYPGADDKPIAIVAFDPQCPDCDHLQKTIKPLMKDIKFIFYPISYLNIHSEPQGTTMLIAEEPWKVLEEQHEHFKDSDMRGIHYDVSKLPVDVRDKVWTNTKLHRRAGCRSVPYGVFKNSKGEYVPFDENLTTPELAEIFEIKDFKAE